MGLTLSYFFRPRTSIVVTRVELLPYLGRTSFWEEAGKKRLVGCVAEFLIDVSRLCMYPRGVPHKPRLTVVNYSF